MEKDNETMQGFSDRKETEDRKNTQGREQKSDCNRTACWLELYSLEPGTKLGSTDWNKEAELIKSL